MEKSCKLLKVTGILMIIFGGIGIILALLAFLGAGVIAQADQDLAGLVIVGSVLLLVSAAIQLIAGVLGVKNHNKPHKANVCLIFAVIVMVLALVGIIIDVISMGVTSGIFFSVIIGFAIPVLYLIGSLKLKKLAN